MRSFHLIKGFAQALGLQGVQAVAHELEARLLSQRPGVGSMPLTGLRALLEDGIRKLDAVIARLHEVDLRAAAEREWRLPNGAADAASTAKRQDISLAGLFARIESAARGIALDLGCPVEIGISCESGSRIDAGFEAPIEAALLHAVRNSLDHGSAGARPPLHLAISATRGGGELVIECKDSGAGIDPTRVREAAGARQARFDAEMGSMSDEEVLQLLFLPGFSLSRGVSRLSGRGYGLDIVREAIETRLGGRARISSRPGQGTTLTLRVPLRRA
jgi:two-component system chemotaxis sensor kinase CheA